uniref:Uncharacterized protein n=1 Tax=Oryzias latipes TaxID=8090 RepID=A0A3B3HNJ4_ORYLA
MKIAAFNMKNFGQKKVSDDKVVGYLVKIMSQYSIVVILEVMDESGEAMKLLLEKLNSSRSNKESPYGMICSKSLGRDTYKEKYVCFYRTKEVELKDSKQYADDQPGDEDAFAREPFILRFSCPSTAVTDIVLIPVHTQPVKAEKELDELFDVVQQVRTEWKTDVLSFSVSQWAGPHLFPPLFPEHHDFRRFQCKRSISVQEEEDKAPHPTASLLLADRR